MYFSLKSKILRNFKNGKFIISVTRNSPFFYLLKPRTQASTAFFFSFFFFKKEGVRRPFFFFFSFFDESSVEISFDGEP